MSNFTEELTNLSFAIEEIKDLVENEEDLYPLFNAMIALSLKLKMAGLA